MGKTTTTTTVKYIATAHFYDEQPWGGRYAKFQTTQTETFKTEEEARNWRPTACHRDKRDGTGIWVTPTKVTISKMTQTTTIEEII